MFQTLGSVVTHTSRELHVVVAQQQPQTTEHTHTKEQHQDINKLLGIELTGVPYFRNCHLQYVYRIPKLCTMWNFVVDRMDRETI